MIKTEAIFLSALIMLSVTLSAQVADSSHISKEKPCKTVLNTLLAPTILIGTGIATMDDKGWYSSQDAYECIQENYPGFHTKAENYLVFLPALAVYGLNWAGVKGKNNFLDRSLILLVSVSLASVTSGIIKRSTDVLRPDGSDYLSFPSSHTALAFASATFLHEEYKDQSIWYGVAGYSVATASGVLRMLNNKHWMSDVLVGAGIGILTTKITYLLYPLVKDCIGNRRKQKGDTNLSMVPYVAANHYGNHYGIHLQYQFR